MNFKTIISAVVAIILQLLKTFNRNAENKQHDNAVEQGRDEVELAAHREANNVSSNIADARRRMRDDYPKDDKYNRRRKSDPLS